MDQDKAQNKIIIYSYSRVWKVEKKLYAIQNLILPVPIDIWQVFYFVILWGIFNVIFGGLPGFKQIPVVIRSLLIPFITSRFLLTKKLDGKNPIHYIIGIIRFLFVEQGKVLETFRMKPMKKQTVKLCWNCSRGTRE